MEIYKFTPKGKNNNFDQNNVKTIKIRTLLLIIIWNDDMNPVFLSKTLKIMLSYQLLFFKQHLFSSFIVKNGPLDPLLTLVIPIPPTHFHYFCLK